MYIVLDKNTGTIIHRNPAPMEQQLTPGQVYALFDPETMEIGAGDGPLPEHFKIENGLIRELTLDELITAGIVSLAPGQKIVDNMVVEKTLLEKVTDGLITLTPGQKIIGEGIYECIVEKTTDEKVKEGLITLAPNEKLVGKGSESKIVNKTLREQVRDGLLNLAPTQKITGEGPDEQIIEKTIPEQVADGTIQLQPSQKLEGDLIVPKTDREMLDEGLMTLDDYKQKRIRYFSDLSLAQRQIFLPDYKLQNVALGVYDDERVSIFKATVQAFKDEFNRLKGLVEQADDAKAVDAVTPNYPDKFVE